MTQSTDEIFAELNRVHDRPSAIAAAERLAQWYREQIGRAHV